MPTWLAAVIMLLALAGIVSARKYLRSHRALQILCTVFCIFFGSGLCRIHRADGAACRCGAKSSARSVGSPLQANERAKPAGSLSCRQVLCNAPIAPGAIRSTGQIREIIL